MTEQTRAPAVQRELLEVASEAADALDHIHRLLGFEACGPEAVEDADCTAMAHSRQLRATIARARAGGGD